MEKHFPVTKVQSMVLGALGLEATHFDEAKELLAHLGLTVNVKREGRTTVPSIRVEDRVGGGWNGGGDADTWQQSPYMDLTPLMQWIVNPEYAERVTAKYRQMQDEQKRMVEQDEAHGEQEPPRVADSTVEDTIAYFTVHGMYDPTHDTFDAEYASLSQPERDMLRRLVFRKMDGSEMLGVSADAIRFYLKGYNSTVIADELVAKKLAFTVGDTPEHRAYFKQIYSVPDWMEYVCGVDVVSSAE